jgi:hypothetical protein
VGEEQAIGYFTDRCREGTLLKHKLHRTEPKRMADFMASQHQPEANPSRHPAKVDITTVIAMARERMSVVITSTAPSKWPLYKEAQGLRVEVRSARETSSARTSTPSR